MEKQTTPNKFGRKATRPKKNYSFLDDENKPDLTLISNHITAIEDGEVVVDKMWLSNEVLRYIYNESTKSTPLLFHSRKIPLRCNHAIKILSEELTTHLRKTRARVSKVSVQSSVVFLVKHISRLKWHSRLGLRFNYHEKYWKEVKGKPRHNVSHNYLIALLDMLFLKGNILIFKGWGSESGNENIMSMLVPKQEFVDFCTGVSVSKHAIPAVMETSLKEYRDKAYIVRERIPDPEGKKPFIKVERDLKRGEKVKANSINEAMVLFDNHVAKFAISINDVLIPEVWFHRTFILDLEHGGRLCCGAIQNRSKKDRLTMEIDGMSTITWDFESLHISMAAEIVGWKMGKHNPYATNIDLPLDKEVVSEYMETYGLEEYDPIRNMCKNVVNILLNAIDKKSAVKAISQSLYKDTKKKDPSARKFVGLAMKGKVVELVDDLIARNYKVKDFFHSDAGIKLQHYESEIAQLVVDEFRGMGKVAIPVHDSATAKQEDIELLERVMQASYKFVMKTDKNCKLKLEG